MFCPRRNDMLSYAGYSPVFEPDREGEDTWKSGRGEQDFDCCSYCHSIKPEDVFAGIEDGTIELAPTDKGYKVYIDLVGDGLCPDCRGSGLEDLKLPEKCWLCKGSGKGAQHHQVAKFYFQHFSTEDRERFLELHNANKIKYGYPGYLYRLPYFTRTAE